MDRFGDQRLSQFEIEEEKNQKNQFSLVIILIDKEHYFFFSFCLPVYFLTKLYNTTQRRPGLIKTRQIKLIKGQIFTHKDPTMSNFYVLLLFKTGNILPNLDNFKFGLAKNSAIIFHFNHFDN